MLRIHGGDNPNGKGTSTVPVKGGRPIVLGGIDDASWSPEGSLLIGTYFGGSEVHAVGLATMKSDGTGISMFWLPKEYTDRSPQTPFWIT